MYWQNLKEIREGMEAQNRRIWNVILLFFIFLFPDFPALVVFNDYKRWPSCVSCFWYFHFNS